MVSRTTRLRVRRRVRSARRNVETVQSSASSHIEKHVVKRWQKFADVRRFVLGWLVLIVLLMGGMYLQARALRPFYTETVPIAGGVLTEGVVGELSNFNPIYAATAPDKTVSALLFEPLIRYDSSAELTSALAQSWSVSADQTIYTLTLRPNLVWHDGTSITTNDVVFTFDTIQHPDTESPLNESWRGVTVERVDDSKVQFTLPNAYTPFLHGLTRVGILPSHILNQVPPKELRSHSFNLSPRVGSGPFSFASVVIDGEFGQVRLAASERYYRGSPQLSEFIVQSFADHEQLVAAYNEGEITSAAGIRVGDLGDVNDALANVYSPQQFNNVMVFMNMNEPPLDNAKIRRALADATSLPDIFKTIDGRYALSRSPLLSGQLGYSDKYEQKTGNKEAAQKVLTELGWKLEDGVLMKSGRPLQLTLVTQNSDEYPAVATEIQRQWKELGIDLKVEVLEPSKLQQDRILPHAYQLVLIGIEQGVDPDPFVFWHSSEARVAGLNFSEYSNVLVDAALESGRTRDDRKLRIAKYQSFLKEWMRDTPAIALYRPSYFYGQVDIVKGYQNKSLPSPVDRFTDVHTWTMLSAVVDKKL